MRLAVYLLPADVSVGGSVGVASYCGWECTCCQLMCLAVYLLPVVWLAVSGCVPVANCVAGSVPAVN
jgi:hypothetical protein